MTTDKWLEAATVGLRNAGIEFPQMEARILLQSTMNITAEQLLSQNDDLNFEQFSLADALLHRRLVGEPIAYIVGHKEFYGRPFFVDRNVLIPRPETELLVDAVIALTQPGFKCVDVGTGSGCIGITASFECPGSSWVCTDVSSKALAVARRNAVEHNAPVAFVHTNLLESFADESVDLVVSNPPYVPEGDPRLHYDVLRWEPAAALFAGQEGLEAIRLLISGARRALKPRGALMFEFGVGQGDSVAELLGGWMSEIRKDLAGTDRVAIATKPFS